MRFILFILFFSGILYAQDQTVGVFVNTEDAFTGYTLFAPMSNPNTYLIDNNGELINSWESINPPGKSVYLLENGQLLRTEEVKNNYINAGGAAGKVMTMDWDGTVTWQFIYSDSLHRAHHDIAPMPNGNVLMISWELKSKDEAIAAGRDTALLKDNKLWPDEIIEIKPLSADSSEIVWEWHAWDHLIQDYDSTRANYGRVAAHPERIDLNFSERSPDRKGHADWLHVNAIDYNSDLDQIMISVHGFSEFWIIDHSTTTEEAAGHTGGRYGKGGDLLFRWGNPAAYRNGDSATRMLYMQHDAHWIPEDLPGAGHVLVFNNGNGRPDGAYSTVDELQLMMDMEGNYLFGNDGTYLPEYPVWEYGAENPTDFYSQIISGSQRLPNGNTLICEGVHGTFFEVTPDSQLVWMYVNPVIKEGPVAQGDTIPSGKKLDDNAVFRCYRYTPEYPGLAGQDLSPKGLLELTTISEHSAMQPGDFELYPNYPNPFNSSTTIVYNLPKAGNIILSLFNVSGQNIRVLAKGYQRAGKHTIVFDALHLPSGLYFLRLMAENKTKTCKIVLLK